MKLSRDVYHLVLIAGGVVVAAISAAIGAYMYENRKSSKSAGKKSGKKLPDVSLQNLKKIRDELKIEFDPNDPNDPLAAIIAAGEYFRESGCGPGGAHYDETMQRVLDMVAEMVPPGRVEFWQEQVYRLYGPRR